MTEVIPVLPRPAGAVPEPEWSGWAPLLRALGVAAGTRRAASEIALRAARPRGPPGPRARRGSSRGPRCGRAGL